MKIIKMFGNKEFLVEDDEAENIAQQFNFGKFIKLRNGDYINPRGIESIGELEKIPYWEDYQLNKDGRSFMRDGVRVYLDPENFKEIEYRINPKYKLLNKKLLKNEN